MSPANTPDNKTRTGIRMPKTILLVLDSSSLLEKTWPSGALSRKGRAKFRTELNAAVTAGVISRALREPYLRDNNIAGIS